MSSGPAKDDPLVVLSGPTLDFGDCYGGHWTRQLLVLKNTGDTLLDVEFGVQKGVEANFQLAELCAQGDEEEHPHDDLPPKSTASDVSISSGGEESSAFSSIIDTGSAGVPDVGRASDSGLDVEASNDLTKTPTHHAHVCADQEEPPRLEFSTLEALSSQLAHNESTRKDKDRDVDASSVASQAGSRTTSPAKPAVSLPSDEHLPSHLTPKESLSARLERVETGRITAMERSQSVRSAVARAASEGDRVSVSTDHQSQTSSGFLSRPSSRGRWGGLRVTEADEACEAGSAKSDATAHSQDSRLGPFAAMSSSHASPTNGSRHHRFGPAVALSGLRNVEQAHSNQLEELVLRPGGEYRVVVSFRPPRDPIDEEYTGGRLVDRTFQISLDYGRARSGSTRAKGGRERRTVLCQSRTCTSFISISPKLIDLGEVQVGTRKSAHVSVTNHSELTARVDLRFISKVLSMYRDEVAIPALQTVDLKVDSFPRRVNETYRKQITVANLLNRHDDQIFEVRSTNVDKQRVSFHSLFYRILTPTGSNFIDFGDVNINSTRMRTFTIENTSGSKLALELTAAHPEDVTLYVKAPTEKKKKAEVTDATSSTESKAPVRVSNKYAELEDAEGPTSPDPDAKGKSQKPVVKGSDLKERFLEAISVDSPAPIRRENASWRLAQKNSHYTKKEKTGSSAQKKENGSVKPKAPINLFSALKKGGKGRLTQQWGKSITFKDRKLLSDFEYLDLATGPPVDARRISAKSKRYQTLELQATGGKSAKAPAGNSSKSKAGATSAKDAGPSANGEAKGGRKSRASSGSSGRKLPSPLAKEIEAGTPLKDAQANAPPATPILAKAEKDLKGDGAGRVHFSPALTGKRKAAPVLSNPVDVSRLSIEDLLAAVEAQNSTLSTLFMGSSQAEEQFIRAEINLQRELQAVIESGRLIPIEVLGLEPGAEKQVIAVYHPCASTRPHIQGNARKQDSRIFMRLIDFNMSVVKASEEFSGMADLEADELPVRDLMMRSNTCRSILELGQPHINFGHMEKGNSKTRKILVQNRSEWALRYCIRKSGSIASGDIKFSTGRYGVVPGYGKREVEFVFSPSMSGQFQEKLVVENVADRENDQMVILKANVRKVPNFAVDPASIDFGACANGKLSTPESFVLTNTTSKARTFVIAIDPHGLLFQRCIVDVALSMASDGEVRGTLTKEEEEEVENISQKLKIANRKGNTDKVKKYEDRLAKLGVKPAAQSAGSNSGEPSEVSPPASERAASPRNGESADQSQNSDALAASESGDAETNSNSGAAPENPAAKLKRVSSTVTCGLAANQSKRLVLRVRASAVQSAIRPGGADPSDRRSAEKAGIEEVEVAVKVHEVKNQDETKIVMIKASVEFELGCAGERTEDPMPADAVIFSPLTEK